MLVYESELLANEIEKSEWRPDVVLAIKTGGVYVAKPLFEKMYKANETLKYIEVGLSRPSTQKKKKYKVSKILKRLPYWLLNILRKVEVSVFEYKKAKVYNPSKELHVKIDTEVIDTLLRCKNLLLVDDAVDTGSTLLAMKNVIEKEYKGISIKTAVLTSTHKHAYIEVDYKLYSRTLLRCPWAEDYKNV